MPAGNFSNAVKPILNAIKLTCRRADVPTSFLDELQAIGITRQALSEADELRLYQKSLAVQLLLQNTMASSQNSRSHLGTHRHTLKKVLSTYQPMGNRVVHMPQQSSRALVKAIQLASLPAERLDKTAASALNACTDILVQHGSNEHLQRLERAFKLHQARHHLFFMLQISYLSNARRKRMQEKL